MVVAEEMEHGMYREKGYLTFKAVAVFLRLLSCLFERDDYVSEHGFKLGGHKFVAISVKVQQGEGKHICGTVNISVLLVECVYLFVVGKGDRDLRYFVVTFIFERFEYCVTDEYFKVVIYR